MLMSMQNLVKFCPLILKILSGNEILTSIKGNNSVLNLRNLTLYNPNLDIINVNVYAKFGQFCPFVLKILSGNEILTSNKDHNTVANLRNLTLYNPNLDIIYVNGRQNLVKFCSLVLKILSNRLTELQNNRITEGQGKSSIAGL